MTAILKLRGRLRRRTIIPMSEFAAVHCATAARPCSRSPPSPCDHGHRPDRHDDGRLGRHLDRQPSTGVTPIQINEQTVRQIVHTSIGGGRVRVRLSNAYGTSEWSSARLTWPSHRWRIDSTRAPIGC